MQTAPVDQTAQPHSRETLYPDLLGMRLMRLMRLMRILRESGAPRYEREVGYKDIERRLILLVGHSGGLSSQEIVALTGYEKAQVSRAVKRLEHDRVMQRASLRAKLGLTEAGNELFKRLRNIVRERDGEFTAGIPPEELARFSRLTDELAQQAARMYADERLLSVQSGLIVDAHPSSGATPWPSGPDGKPVEPPPNLLIPRIFRLVAHVRRGAMLVYQRTQGLSTFQAQSLALIGRNPPLLMADLIIMMGHDKSQIGRALTALEEAGLITRYRPSRRRDVALEPTERGAVAHREMYAVAVQRDGLLWSGHDDGDRAFYSAMVEQLMERASAMIDAAERASAPS